MSTKDELSDYIIKTGADSFDAGVTAAVDMIRHTARFLESPNSHLSQLPPHEILLKVASWMEEALKNTRGHMTP